VRGYDRIPHVVPRAELVALLAPTYAAARAVDEEEARERLEQALARGGIAADLHRALAAALRAVQGPRTSEDALVDRLAAGLAARRARVKAAAAGPAVAAVLVRLDLEIGVAPEPMRATLEGERGRALLAEGLRTLAEHLVRQLVRP
jgi:hypothetical protein